VAVALDDHVDIRKVLDTRDGADGVPVFVGDVDLVQLHQAVRLAQLRERHDAVVWLFKFEPQ
jgi:hypothetical protein